MIDKLTKAMILAAGFGTRLKPLTLTAPKALIKYKGMPLIEHAVKKLVLSGIEEIVVNTHYFSEEQVQKKGFCGIHILSSDIFDLFPQEDKFDIIPFYLQIAKEKSITFYDIGNTRWKDLGKYEDFV